MIRTAYRELLGSHALKQLRASVVYVRQRPRSIWDKTDYVPDWVPREKKYHHSRKPRLPQWDDPNIHWPPVSVRPTKLQGKALLNQLKEEDKVHMQLTKNYTVPDFRPGDTIKFHYLHSLSEGNGNTITALCVGLHHPNSLMGSFSCLFNFAGVPVNMRVKLHSPYLTNLERVAKGSGDLKYKLAYIWKLNRQTITVAPIIKRSMKQRDDEPKKKTVKQSPESLKGFKADNLRDKKLLQ